MTSDEILVLLRNSALFRSDLPRRASVSYSEAARMSEAERARLFEPGIAAIRATPDHSKLSDLVRAIGRARHAPSVPLLVELWHSCAVKPVRVAAGFALREIGTPESRAALQSAIDEADHMSTQLAIAAIFDEDPRRAYDRLAPRFERGRVSQPGGAAVPDAVLRTFAPSSFTGGQEIVPHWHDPRARHWLEDDTRWLDLCTSLRRDEVLGNAARQALRWADPTRVKDALERVRRLEPPVVRRVRSVAQGDLLARYLRGDYEAVWRELRTAPAIDGAFREEALAVSRETMRRFGIAADRIAERLASKGWQPLSGALRTAPSPDDANLIAQVERITDAPLPPGLRAFWEIVGGVDFIWNYNLDEPPPNLGVDVELEDLDALAIDPPPTLVSAFDAWEDDQHGLIDPELGEPFRVDLAPDRLTKADISGGPPYGIELPFPGVDPCFGNGEWSAPLVEYLRSAARWGGFPGLAKFGDRNDVQRLVSVLGKDLDPF
jgi:hypothetical protein